MKRLLIRIVLAISFLFIGARLQTSLASGGCHYPPAFKKADSPTTGKEQERIKAVEVEEDEESESFHQYLSLYTDFTDYYTAIIPACTYLLERYSLPFCEHFSYASLEKYLLHLVIRI